MRRVRLIHFNAAQAPERAEKIRQAGYAVTAVAVSGLGDLAPLRRDPPDAVVIDLSRRPAGGRDVAVALRTWSQTRHIALVFVDGERAWEERISELLPDAAFTQWRRIRGSVQRAIAQAPAGRRARRRTPTAIQKKLGIPAATTVAILGAPEDFAQSLGPLPAELAVKKQLRGPCDLIVYFAPSQRRLRRRIDRLSQFVGVGGVWVLWPRRSAAASSDLNASVVRQIGTAAGLRDSRACRIDANWSGLRFTPGSSG